MVFSFAGLSKISLDLANNELYLTNVEMQCNWQVNFDDKVVMWKRNTTLYKMTEVIYDSSKTQIHNDSQNDLYDRIEVIGDMTTQSIITIQEIQHKDTGQYWCEIHILDRQYQPEKQSMKVYGMYIPFIFSYQLTSIILNIFKYMFMIIYIFVNKRYFI